MTIIKSFKVRDRHFTIVLDKGFYQAIENKYIDENGRLTQTLWGHQTFANKDLNECLKGVQNKVEMDYLIANGYTKAQAFVKVFNIDTNIVALEKVEELFA